MSDSDCNDSCCSISKCDIFDFMAKHVGLTVIHPGGLKATHQLTTFLNINRDTKVIDIACGKGTTAFYLAEKYDCNVIGIDISEELIEEAKCLKKKKGLDKKVIFEIGDAMQLPFGDNEFDVAISQAMLILVEDKIATIKETNRVIKNGGRAGWLELSWREKINQDFLEKVSKVLCAYCMTNVNTYDEWEEIFKKAGINNISVIKGDNFRGSYIERLRDEGFVNTFKIIYNTMKNKEIRQRMNVMNKFFKEHEEYFGYGIYYYQKGSATPTQDATLTAE